jgi:hypothetical protein
LERAADVERAAARAGACLVSAMGEGKGAAVGNVYSIMTARKVAGAAPN